MGLYIADRIIDHSNTKNSTIPCTMTTRACENCHSKPKFAGHKYCGKTCAAQAVQRASAATAKTTTKVKAVPSLGTKKTQPVIMPRTLPLCDYCGQKPKFNNFNYCGKHCAALANALSPPVQPVNTGRPAAKPAPHPAVQKAVRQPINANTAAARPPAVITPAFQNDSSEDEGEGDDDDGTDLDAYPSDSSDENNPIPPPPRLGSRSTLKTAGQSNPKQSVSSRRTPGVCIIPGCGKPSHVDKNGAKTDYCSVGHREEGVNLGYEEACIMCSRYPQSGTDYFCSKACREQAMNKP
ncbi:hypothetical protein BJ138DRAFT_1180465 [Hygrophoropsis aurantiaca]|uniref:Uncharacterized protein n=1 Tax=Hygrophoropsis aurantiaca TaxID=72124 RepID=A0ACB8A9Y7_9AGAM|nr:hypothetical protein BJ138DRAFT_1180465 [Hygrophoropsis aurantiaca]